MAVRRTIPVYDGVFFISFTCSQWENLFQIADAYQAVYKWFDFLKHQGHYIVGYVIMPNHLHAIIAFRNTKGQSFNTIIGNGKRFIAYWIISALEELDKVELLELMKSKISAHDKTRKKLHQVFEPSFDWKECKRDKFIQQKLDYMHMNPCKGTWNLADEYWQYPHSSALFYVTGQQGIYPVTNAAELRNIDLTVPKVD